MYNRNGVQDNDGASDQIALRNLLIWAAFMKHDDLCRVIVCHLHTRLCALLIASKIFKTHSRKYSLTSDSREHLAEIGKRFEQDAIEQLNNCYAFDRKKACILIMRENKIFGNVTCLQVNELFKNQL